jgi:tripartite-type tricarboxylate transporter receptor subunit TctC
MKAVRSMLLRCVCALSALALSAGSLAAEAAANYPSKPVKVLVGFPAGQGSDAMARAVAERLQGVLGQTFFVENKVGASGALAQQAAATAPPDGYTILLTSAGPMVVSPGVQDKLPYDPIKDYAPIGGLINLPMVLVSNPEFPVHDLKELVALARAKPGEINYASSGRGLTAHLSMEMLSLAANIKMTHVPYKGTSPAMTDLIGGRVGLMFDTPVGVMAMVKSGRVRALAVGGKTRLASLPDVPTIAESGYPGFAATTWMGLVAPAKTPAPIVRKLSDALLKVVNDPETHKYFRTQEVEPMPMDSAEFGAFIKSEIDKWGGTAKRAGVKIE